MTQSSLLADLIDLNQTLDADRASGLEQRKRRDRAIGRNLQQLRDSPVSQLRAWLRAGAVAARRDGGARGVRLYHGLNLALLVSGLLAGWGLATAVLYYDGRQPINIVNAVVVLVLPQILLLLLWMLTALPGRLPLFNSIGAALGFLHPGRLTAHLAGVFNGGENRGLAMLWHPDNVAVLAPAARWLFSFWSQLFACSFNIGVLAGALFLVSFSDLAFVWSTTLTLTNADFHGLLRLLSAPWSGVFPAAVPGAELVANSRFYRLDEGSLADPAGMPGLAVELGQWWPFLIAAVACYGLLPRLVTLAVSWQRLRHHLRRALCNLPGAPELLARMNSPLVSTLAAKPEQALELGAGGARGTSRESGQRLQCALLDWSGARSGSDDIDSLLAAMGIEATQWLNAGGRRTTEQDLDQIALLCRGKPAAVSILVKAWEPPMLDFLDFVRALRDRCGAKIPLIVLLRGSPGTVSAAERETWQLTLARLGDPQLHVETLGTAP